MSHRVFSAPTFRSFLSGDAGSLAVPMAVSAALLVGGVGVAVDLTRVVTQKEKVQGVADVASLAAAKSGETSNGQLRRIADAVFIQHLGPDAEKMIASVERNGDAVTVVARDTVPTTLARMFGYDEVDLSVDSTSVYAERRMDIALVLDTTLSMGDDGKIDALKRSAKGFVDTIDGLETDSVKIGIAPYAQHVNVGLKYRDATWLDVPADRVTPSRYQCRTHRPVVSRGNCRSVQRSRTRDGRRQTYTARVCDTTHGDPVETCGMTRERTETWQGCVGSRMSPLDEAPAYGGRKIPGLLNKPCGAELLAPTADMSDVRATIDSLRPQGDTYMPAGLLWGWRMLDTSIPLANADPAPDGDRVLVLMTDGLNTRSKNGNSHGGHDQLAADRKTASLCAAMKAQGTTVYTIAYGVDNGATRTLLQNCATSGTNYFDARDASQLEQAFDDIANSVRELRVSA